MISGFSAALDVILHAEEITRVFGLRITNSMLLGWIVSFVLVVTLVAVARRIKVRPGGALTSLVEVGVETVTGLAADVMHDRKRAAKYAPFLITLFCFILFNNWFGLLPGVGTITVGHLPLFRAWTSDLTGTLALAISSIIIIQIYAIRELGILGHVAHYFSDRPWNPINLFVGLLEVLGEFTRVASLSLRLFGNIFAGEVLLLVLSSLTSYGSPIATLPFIFMELFVGLIQAFVFTMLVIVYLSLATSHHEETNPGSETVAQNMPEVSPAASRYGTSIK